mmetsp:Transcript_40403/g.81451  ORF Transcript_40403/g.81451 Transcript_40403/m.81451 type:complete len:269 (-) Transcript_40403:132-938(-)
MVFGNVSASGESQLDPVFQAQEHCRELHSTLKILIQEGGNLTEHIGQANLDHQSMGSEAQSLQQRKAIAELEALLVRIEITESIQRSKAAKHRLQHLQQHVTSLEQDLVSCSEAQQKAKQTLLDVDGMHEAFKAMLHRARRDIREYETRIAETAQQKSIAASFNERIERKAVENTKLGEALSETEKQIKEVSTQLHIKEAELDWIVADHDEILTEKRTEMDSRDAECAFLGGQVESLEEQMNELAERERTTAMVTESLREKLKRLNRR